MTGSDDAAPPGVTSAPRSPTRPHARGTRRLAVVAVACGALALLLALLVAPAESIQGQAQRLMYVHVPAAWTGFLAFAVTASASVLVLLRGGRRWDAVARGSAELGVAMTALAIAEGSVWGHSAWGVWWTFDPRIVTTSLLLLLYTGYLLLRALPGDPDRVRRRAAVVGVVCFVQVPVVHFSVLWWRTLHQPPTLLRPDLSPPIDGLMLLALVTSVLAFTLAGAWYVLRRVQQLTVAGPTGPSRPVDRTAHRAAGAVPARVDGVRP